MRPVLLLLALGACAGSTPPPEPVAPAESAGAPAPEVEAPVALVRDGTIARAELLPVLDAGLGHFLRGVRVEPSRRDGAFEGFRLTHLYPDDPRFQAIDLRPGDVVLRINERPIERPEQALVVWEELRVVSQLVVDYRRGDEERSLRFAIID
ncbi:MAG: hypothetical protein AAGH15_12815 [Myxococcota bacterium]